jgi:hypothetical protein
MIGKFYVYNALTLTTKIMEIGRDPDCALCGLGGKGENAGEFGCVGAHGCAP